MAPGRQSMYQIPGQCNTNLTYSEIHHSCGGPQPSPSSFPGAGEGPVVPPAPCGCARGLTCPRSKTILCIQLHSTRLMKLRLTVCSPDNQLLWGVQTPTVRDSSNKALAGLPLRPTLTSLVLQEDPNLSSPSPSRRGAYFLLQTSWD